jgi:hypothetical protein
MVWAEISLMGCVALFTWVGANFPREHHEDLQPLPGRENAAR